MLKKMINSILFRLGYSIRRIDIQNREGNSLFVLHKYLKSDGGFDYEKYYQTQVKGNKRKVQKVWVLEENIAFLSEYIKRIIGNPAFGICHGTRNGKEQAWFRKFLGCDVIGTEISDTAEQFSYTIQWDFHDTKPEWIDTTDFIYSNALDHSYDPEKCLDAWMSCVRRGGLCILEHSSEHEIGLRDSPATKLDPFKADLVIMPYLITVWAKGRYVVREILVAPAKAEDIRSLNFIVIQKL